MATSFIGTGEPETPTKNIASNSISEDAKTKELQRTVPNKSDGTEIFTTANPGAVSLPSATVTTLTPPAAITNFANETGGNLAAVKTAVEVIDNIVSGSEAQVDVVAALPAGTNIIGAVKRDVINYTSVNKYVALTGAQTDGIVWSPASGKQIVVTDISLTVSAAATVTLEWDKSAGDEAIAGWDLAANGGVSMNLQTPLVCSEDDADLIVTTSAGNVKVTVVGYEI